MSTVASRAMIATNAICMVGAGLAVALRLHLRRKQKFTGSTADDWLIVGALLFSVALAVTNIIGVPVGGFGLPFTSLGDGKAETFLKILFIHQFWYIIAVALVKLSILCFYGRLFSAVRYPVLIKVLLAVTLAWVISFLFATFFQVWPIRCNWIACDPTTKYWIMYAMFSVTDLLLDVCVLCLPASFVRRLNMSGSEKIGLIGIFGLGLFCIIASIARLSYAIKYWQVNIEGNYEINFAGPVVNMIMWSGIEACTSTICANLPCYGPLLKRGHSLGYVVASIRSAFKHPTGYISRRGDTKTSRNSFIEIQSAEGFDADRNVPSSRTLIQGGPRSVDTQSDVELGQIKVETTVGARSGF